MPPPATTTTLTRMDAWVVLAVIMMVGFFGALLLIVAWAAFGLFLLARRLVDECARFLRQHGSHDTEGGRRRGFRSASGSSF